MGQRTYYSIGRVLPNRTNIVLTTDPNFQAQGCLVAHSLEEAFELGAKHDQEEIFVIGGGMVYKNALPFANKLYLTVVEGVHDADVYFPEYEDIFKKVIKQEPYENNQYKFKFLELVKE
jgi:dihydrofolate reductase